MGGKEFALHTFNLFDAAISESISDGFFLFVGTRYNQDSICETDSGQSPLLFSVRCGVVAPHPVSNNLIVTQV